MVKKDKIISEILKEVSYLKKNGIKNIQFAIFNDYVKQAFLDFIKEMPEGEWAVIGGLAVSTLTKPRETQDIDITIIGITIPKLPSFKRIRPSAFEHKKTGVEVELLIPEVINQPDELVKKAIDNAIVQEVNQKRVKIVSPKFLIALKLERALQKTREGYQDRTDILSVLETYGKQDLSDLNLPQEQLDLYKELLS